MSINKKRVASKDVGPKGSFDGAQRNPIYERLMNAIAEHRLHPGTKLAEDRLAAIFGVSRTVVRAVLQQLAHEMVVTIVPNRGAFIASPTVEEARELFEARRHIELPIVEKVCRSATKTDIALLRAHMAREQEARKRDDRRTAVRLSGDFHVLLAHLGGNRFIERTMRGLQMLTCLTILLYNAPTSQACPHDEHADLIDAIEAGNARLAQKLMVDHLAHIEASLRLNAAEEKDDDLEAILLRGAPL
ncbi:TPA: GntR family transcriptional regulator [Burkholderia contaminans]|uniref:GntR family transcriptional regulator n=1 Tax=Burkholderia cepacia complex TaxID=87882 RepID=UPI000A632C43|nr:MULTISPECIES: GntR family transcriptional regulator [Burkholderia cepacia complex]MBM6430521.1 GntR family transcriptional regulator [Burkholderia contaminans]MCA7881454.1 GntR family transcriptional regulator [Burkholderia contaminans]MDN8026896.1 GntR family transcriptional regulator [Burkholderia contaminans]PRG04760.1 GntR family transcriptional regulator [Burkholderia contaminans]HDR9038211.1 GntR family transcriptional regulator [Burkholderia vietnamiensis]